MEKEQLIPIIKEIKNDVSRYFIKEGTPYIIMEGYESYGDIITLFAKQTNLLESLLLLLEYNHTEEAYVLFRSQINNYMVIVYLLGDDQYKSRFKQYNLQPMKNVLKLLYDVKKGIKEGTVNEDIGKDLDKKIKKWELILKENGCVKQKNGYDTRPISIAKMAWKNPYCLGLYLTYYRNGCIYEHSDSSSLDIYREKISEDLSNRFVFKMNLSLSSTEKEKDILNISTQIYCNTFIEITKKMSANKNLEVLLEKQKLAEIILKIESVLKKME